MNSKIKIKIYCIIINEVYREYEDTKEFINKKLNELCSEHGISAEKVHLYTFLFAMLHTQFRYAHSLSTYTV